jgi:hypothetical protein
VHLNLDAARDVAATCGNITNVTCYNHITKYNP